MPFLTSTQISDLIIQALAGAELTKIQVKDYAADTKRRKYPVVEVVETQPTGSEADIRVTRVTQKFNVILYVRKRGAGSDEIDFIKSAEDVILAKLDATELGSGTLFTENKNWARSAQVIDRPIPHYESTLSVLVTDEVSTSGDGTLGAEMLLSLPGLTDMQMLSKPVEREVEGVEDIFDVTRTRTRTAPTGDGHSFFGEVEYTQARMDALRTLKAAHAKIACTIKRKGVAENFNGYLTEMSHGSGYEEIETIIIRIEVVS
jgi:hypothetical protein